VRLNRLALTAGLAYAEAYQHLKAEQGGLDFTDAELEVAKLLEDDVTAAAVYMKLDARWKHLLLDEFQDTNPLQWRILRAWLDAYGADGERPTVFLVGDPKQSIYRFRRAEPRLFAAARDFLERRFGAGTLRQDETRRCSPRVVAWVNAVFEDLGGAYPDFRRHRPLQDGLPGLCEVIALPPDASAPGDQPSATEGAPTPLRDPLTEPPISPADKRMAEAERVASRILELVGRLEVAEEGGRAARFEDVLVLFARRTGLEAFEAAFKAAGIPYLGSRRGGLLDTLEASDLMALLGFLATPHDDLKLVHALRSPLFGFGDDDLGTLQACGDGRWLRRLQHWAAAAEAPVHVLRAQCLLEEWLTAVGQLPPHDLLDRIFHQGDLEPRYAAAVPDHLRPGVLANLRGILEFSLKLGGGRFPSLPRFLGELEALRQRAGDEAPDEVPAAAGDVVRMLTIHAAKGLEAPVVFIIKADEAARRGEPHGVLLDWPAEQARPAHLSLFGKTDWRGVARQPLFAREQAESEREDLNLLYVAMTRARQALIVSGLADGKANTWLARFAEADERVAWDGLPGMAWLPAAPAPSQTGCAAGPPAALPVTVPAAPVLGCRRSPASPEVLFGIRVHRYLELASQGMDRRAIRPELGLDATEFEGVEAAAVRLLDGPVTRRFFTAGAGRAELEYVGEDGALRRIDRLVELDGELWVLDFKTGGLAEDDLHRRAAPHLGQLAEYRRAARALYPGRRVRAALLFTDGGVFEMSEA
jgi:ATP-dependent helicase/nuclease subunit A